MDKKKKLRDAFDSLARPDKDRLLEKIESKKAFGGEFQRDFEAEQRKMISEKRRKIRALTAIACSIAVILVCVISGSIFLRSFQSGDKDGALYIDHRDSWYFSNNYYISFDETDLSMTSFCEQSGITSVLPVIEDGWTLIGSQITQSENGFRQTYLKDGKEIEITVFIDGNLVGFEDKYQIFISYDNTEMHGNTVVYRGEYTVGGEVKQVYVVYASDAVYFIEYSS